MKALLIADTDISVKTLTDMIEPYGFDIIRYRSAIKALDNIEEIQPDAILISTKDFPRHWKTIVQFIRSDTKKDETVIILLINERFSPEDADKAVHIGVQAIVNESLSEGIDEHKILEVFSRYRYVNTVERVRMHDAVSGRMTFMFTNPLNDTIITGKIDSVSRADIFFKPDTPSATSDLSVNEVLDLCSLKIDGRVYSPSCLIRRNGNFMMLEFTNPEEGMIRDIEGIIGSAG